MARAGLGWDTRELAQRAEVGISTVNRFERGTVQPTRATLAALQRALKAGGIEFRPDGSVRLREAADAEL